MRLRFESELSHLISGAYTNSGGLDLCILHGGKNEEH
jgi:hypothetical protein